MRRRRERATSADRLREVDQLLCGYDEYAEHQVHEHLAVSTHPDRAAAVGVLEQMDATRLDMVATVWLNLDALKARARAEKEAARKKR